MPTNSADDRVFTVHICLHGAFRNDELPKPTLWSTVIWLINGIWLTSSNQSATGTVDIQVTMPTDNSAIIQHTPGDTLFRFNQWRSKGGTWNTTVTPWVL